MFKKKQARTENAASIPVGIPRPSQTVINHAPSEAGRILAWAIVAGVGAVAGWHFLAYLVREGLGYRNPVEAIAWGLVGGSGLIILSVVAYFVITRPLRMYLDYQLQIEEIRADRDRSLALTSSQPLPNESRLTEEDSKFAALLRTVMAEAYKHLDQAGQYAPKEAKPWTRRANTGKFIPGFDKPVTELMASRVSSWLESKGVIDRNGVINEGEFPTLAHFTALLEAEFYLPIQVNKALSPTLGRDGYKFIN